jgi:group I intron endonuclease
MSGCIYLITNKINNKRYIGKTIKSLSTRFYNHCYASKTGSTTYFHKAIRKYGEDSFIIEELDRCDTDILGEKEIEWISKLKPEYNQTLGGDGGMLGYSHTEKTRQLLSLKRKGKFLGEENPFYNQTHTKKQKEKWSKMRKGQPSPCGFAGKSHKEESKSKTSQTLKNNPNVKRTKVFQYDIEGNFLREFQSISDASKFVGTTPSNIKYTCEGKFKHCKGYKWSYELLLSLSN